MRVLVLGASGMAGHVVSMYLRESGFDVDTLSANHPFDKETYLIDVSDMQELEKLLGTNKYDAVINCIGILVKPSEDRKDLAVYINSYLPHFLENHYTNSKTKVIHISTDDVFSYSTPPYKENSAYDGQSFYGRAKALGEIINNKDLTFRMSIVGPSMQESGTGLFNWFCQQTGEVSGYTNAIWHGITTIELAKAIRSALEQNLSGLYHLVPEKSISKYELLELFKDVFGHQSLKINPIKGTAANKTLVNTRKDFNYRVPGYKEMIRQMKSWIEDHPQIYKHYEVI